MKWLDTFKRENQELTEIEQVNQALLEWKMAVDYFEHVADPDMVDYAIYSINAAKCRYDYLVKKCRENNLVKIKQA